MLLQLLLSPKNTSCLDDSSEDKSGTSIHLPAGTKDSSGGQCRALLSLLRALHQKSWFIANLWPENISPNYLYLLNLNENFIYTTCHLTE